MMVSIAFLICNLPSSVSTWISQNDATTGNMNRTYTYNNFGIPIGRTAGSVQNFTYSFDVQKGNLLNRVDNRHSKLEAFVYDNLNRLTSAAGKLITYASNANITRIQSVGTMAYDNNAKSYQVTTLTPEETAVPLRNQTVAYTSFHHPSSIAENGVTCSIINNASGERVKMHVLNGAATVLTRYYISGQYEIDANSNVERLNLGGDAYSAPAVYVKEAGAWKIYYICRAYLDSITHVANADGSLKQELSYDARGRLRIPTTLVAYTQGSEPVLFFGRGYTGHEYLPWFGLVNMIARLYDSALGRFLSPEPFVQMPDFCQNFNRYSYAMNNLLVYIDQNGEFIHLIVGAIIGGTVNLIVNWKNIDGNFWKRLGYFDVGAGVGALSAACGAWAVATFNSVGVVAGVCAGNSLQS